MDEIDSFGMGILDNNSEWLGIPKHLLMECAGYSFSMEVIKRYKLKPKDVVFIFCGTGNNGGDGFVIARHLASNGIKPIVFLAGNPEKIRTPEARLNWKILNQGLIYSVKVEIIKDSSEIEKVSFYVESNPNLKLVIDGLLGTGISGKIREPISTIIDFINEKLKTQLKLPIACIDIPSGFDPNIGLINDKSVRPDLVITFHRIKSGLKSNHEFAKEVIVKPIGIPLEADLFVGRGDVLPTLKKRAINCHKGQFGKVLIIGGSKDYSGAPAYSSLASIAFGIDLVITFVPDVIGNVLRGYSPNLIVRSSEGNHLNDNSLNELIQLVEWADAILIGPGMGTHEETEGLLLKLLEKIRIEKKKCVLDADALKLVKNHLETLKGMELILTPHAGELKIISGIDLPRYDKIDEISEILLDLAKNLNVTLLLKGAYDYISDGEKLKINKTGCPEMSIGGTGDVLSGLCASLLSIGNDPFSSACSAAFINGYAGELCKKNIGERFTSLDLISHINDAISKIRDYSINFKQ
ncbi:MAG: NAD(P)H-hydrate dehydratase [Promethearchaeia archaeon]